MRRLKKFFIPVLIVTAIVTIYGSSSPALASDDMKSPVINVNGIGQIAVEPDSAQISLGVVSEGTTANAAQKDNAQIINRLLAALEKAGIEKKHIQTQDFSVQPQYDYSSDRGDKPKITGYQARNTVVVHVTNIETLGSILDTAQEAGVNQVNNVRFLTSQEKVLRTKALADAVADARAKADTIAKALGKTVSDVVSVTADSNYYSPVAYMEKPMAAGVARDSETSIMTGELTVSASVQVQFSMK